MILAFELTMPRRNSWNGRWSGEERRYIITKTFRTGKEQAKALDIVINSPYFYSWSDGWGARIDVAVVDSAKAAKLRKSAGFCGYNWMVDTIIQYGRPLATHEIQSFLNTAKQEQ
jgi:hypothetical protein